MSISFDNSKAYPACAYSLYQLLHAAKMKLQEATFVESTTIGFIEVDTLEREASEVLCLVRSRKNSSAPINRIPPEILSLIPDYCDKHHRDRALVKLTHVCSSWRKIFLSRSSLWTHLDFQNVDKTRTYIHRSRSSPLHARLDDGGTKSYRNEAFSLVLPHLRRLKSLIISTNGPFDISEHFHSRAPLLEELHIRLICPHSRRVDNKLFGGDLSSLRVLCLARVSTNLPWNNMANLMVLNLTNCQLARKVTVTQLLDFLESAPLLHTVALLESIPDSFDAPRERVVILSHLETITVTVRPGHSILNHLRIPHGASLKVWATVNGAESPLLDYLPETSPNFKNLSNITMLNFCFEYETKYMRLGGPSGSLSIVARWEDWVIPYTMDDQILRSLFPAMLSNIKRLTLSNYTHQGPTTTTEDSPLFQILSSMNNLRSLILSDCDQQPFFFALNPEKNPSELVLCPHLEELILYSSSWKRTEHLINMTESRASRQAKLVSIKMIFLDGPVLQSEVSKLARYVTEVMYGRSRRMPLWDDLFSEYESGLVKYFVRYSGS